MKSGKAGMRAKGARWRGTQALERYAKLQSAETVLGILRERGRKALPLDELYRQLFNPQLYLLFVDRTSERHAGDG